jgi:aflatoxin B1 aldehyde reductase
MLHRYQVRTVVPAQLTVKLTVPFHRALSSKPGDLSPKNLRVSLMDSLKALRRQKVHIFYLHLPDRSVPIEDTLRAINDLYNEGYLYAFLSTLHFPSSTCFSEQFGLSNYNSWEVCSHVHIC